MNINDAIKILDTHNKWRRGANIEMQDPTELGIAMDTVINFVKDKISIKKTEIKTVEDLIYNLKLIEDRNKRIILDTVCIWLKDNN